MCTCTMCCIYSEVERFGQLCSASTPTVSCNIVKQLHLDASAAVLSGLLHHYAEPRRMP